MTFIILVKKTLIKLLLDKENNYLIFSIQLFCDTIKMVNSYELFRKKA